MEDYKKEIRDLKEKSKLMSVKDSQACWENFIVREKRLITSAQKMLS